MFARDGAILRSIARRRGSARRLVERSRLVPAVTFVKQSHKLVRQFGGIMP